MWNRLMKNSSRERSPECSPLDPHSVYMPADSFKEMKISTTGSFGGLGIEITIKAAS